MIRSTVNIPIPTVQFLALNDFLRKANSDKDPVEPISMAIDYWLDNATWKQDVLMPKTVHNTDKGYHWKTIFLPHGTKLRMKYKNEWHYAEILGDKVVFGGEESSPSAFVNKATGTSRNAWRDIWIKRPQDQGWIFAETLRKQAT